MSDPATRRHRMINAFTETHGEEVAMALSENLAPPEIATQSDLHNLHVQIRADLAELKADTDAKFAIVEAKIDALSTSTDSKIDGLATSMDSKIDRLASRIDARFEKSEAIIDATIDRRLDARFHQQTVVLLKWTVGLWVALAAVLVAIAVVS